MGKEKVRNGGEERKRICRKNQWLLLAAAAYLLDSPCPVLGRFDSHQCMASAQDFCRAISAPGEPVAYSYGTAEGPLGYAYTYPSQNGLILYMAVLAFFLWRCGVCSFQILNIGFFILGIVSLQRMTVRGNERCSLLLWMACCLPFSFYILFVYGTMPRIWTFVSGDGTSGAVCGRGTGKRLLDWRGSSSGGGDSQVEL